ncbi:FG-GAP repeat protein [Streptomyces cadmiisoli]|uniref:FG-GAP repeat protein n=1 Tax=Streptomyces cadmiisoli TaxID=2184053 RepID=UPI00365D274B
MGAPDATVAGRAKAGYVAVLYGSANGLRTATKQVSSQNSAGVPGGAEAGDRFGAAPASADLDGDGHQDLIVGVPGEDTVSGGSNSGCTQVIRGGAKRLAGAYSPATGRFAGDGLGERGRLMTADIDGDGAADVVTGVPGEDLGRAADAGAVVVLCGGAGGLTGAGPRTVTQNMADVPGSAEKGDAFGRAVHLGDADGDGRADLAAGAPGENSGAGFVWCFRSTAGGVVSPNTTTAFGASVLGTTSANGRLGSGFAY